MTGWPMNPIWQRERTGAPKHQMSTVWYSSNPSSYQHSMLPSRSLGPTDITQTGYRDAFPMSQAHCIATRPKMDLSPKAICGDTPVERLGTRRGHLEWTMVSKPSGRAID